MVEEVLRLSDEASISMTKVDFRCWGLRPGRFRTALSCCIEVRSETVGRRIRIVISAQSRALTAVSISMWLSDGPRCSCYARHRGDGGIQRSSLSNYVMRAEAGIQDSVALQSFVSEAPSVGCCGYLQETSVSEGALRQAQRTAQAQRIAQAHINQ